MRFYIAIAFLLFVAHQFAEFLGWHNHFLDSYLDDFLFLPLLILVVQFLLSDVFKLIQKLNFNHIFFLSTYSVLVVEFLFPHFSSRFVFDVWDFLAYFSGLMVYLIIDKIYKNVHIKTS